MMKNNPCERQIYDYLLHYEAVNGYSPSIREIGAYIGKAHTVTWNYLRQMRERGMVDWQDHFPRTIHVIAPFKQ